ncbi:MAG: uroporphyrinogen decarboxylase family protein [Victivallales bacterium]
MKCGERIVRCLTGGEIDRVPFGVGLGWNPWGIYESWKRDSGKGELDIAEELKKDKSFALPALESGLFPSFEEMKIKETDELVILKDRQGITKCCRKDAASMPEFLDYPVKTPDDWEKLKQERFVIGDKKRVIQDWNDFKARLKETGESVQVGVFPYGVFGAVRDLTGVENLLTGFYDHPEMIRDMMNHLTSLWLSLWEITAKEVQIDHIHIWEDMSGRQGSLISPAMVEEFMMPCYDRIADFAKSHNVRIVSVDTDGDCSELVPLMMKHGVNMFFPFEVQAGNDILEYRKKYPGLGIMGGLDKRVLSGTLAEVDVEIEKAEAMISKGRYVPMFDHLIPPDAKWNNFKYAAEKIKFLCESSSK